MFDNLDIELPELARAYRNDRNLHIGGTNG
jgi:hypothetical protein